MTPACDPKQIATRVKKIDFLLCFTVFELATPCFACIFEG